VGTFAVPYCTPVLYSVNDIFGFEGENVLFGSR